MSNYTNQVNTTRDIDRVAKRTANREDMYVVAFETETQWINALLSGVLLYMKEQKIDTSLADYLSLIFDRDTAYKMINGLYLENWEIDSIVDWFMFEYMEVFCID